jgi:Carboxypeptidase regulatory-like domain/TonB dependent receptor
VCRNVVIEVSLKRRNLLVLALACLLVSFALAQTPDTATLRGTVTDQTHATIPGAQITATNTDTGAQRTAQTDASGKFAIGGIPVAGSYKITTQKAGFADATLSNVTLIGGASAGLTIQLNAASEQTLVTVTGVAGEVRADEPQIGNRLDAQQIQETPLLNRRVTYLPLLNAANRPAINQGDVFMNQNLFTTNGAGRRQTWFEVDGSSSVDLWGRQTVFTNLPIESLQEMQVLTNVFSAEYGGTTGGVVNMVTRPGSNDYHGAVVALFRPSDLGAKLSGYSPATITNGNAVTSDSLKQTAAMFSGPIGARTHFVLSGEYSWQNRISPITSPVAPGNFEGHYRGWLGFVRLDHQFNDKQSLFFRGNVDSFFDTNPNGAAGGNSLPSVDRIFKRRTYTMQMGETAVLSPTFLNDVRVNFDLASPITEFDPVVYSTQFQVPIAGVGTFTSGTSQSAKLLNHQFGITDTLAATFGKHTLRFGGSALHAHNGGNSKEFGGPLYLGQFIYKTCSLGVTVCESSSYLGNIANINSYTQAYGNAVYTVDDTLWSLFVQDDIHATQALTLNLGLRYERQTLTEAARDLAPRLGFAYNIHGDGKTVVRGGYGIYYSTIPDNAAANWALTGPTGVFNYTASAGQPGFPTSTTSVPLPAFPAGGTVPIRTLYLRPGRASYYDQFFPTSTLIGYQNGLLNPYSQQWTFGIERRIADQWVLSVDYVGSHTIRINRPLDVDPPTSFVRTAQGQTRTANNANCTRPFWISWYAQRNLSCNPTNAANPAAVNPQPPYALIQSDVNNGYGHYHALDVNLRHHFSHGFDMLLSYTWSHALSNVDPDIPGQNPNDPRVTGREEYGPSIFDERHRFVLSGTYAAPWKIRVGGIATLGSGLPYNITTGSTNSGDNGATADRPVTNGVVIGRNAGRGKAIYDLSPFIERAFPLGSERVKLNLRFESFNIFNHANFVGYNSIYGNAATPPACVAGTACFGQPAVGITNQLPARSVQVSGKLTF